MAAFVSAPISTMLASSTSVARFLEGAREHEARLYPLFFTMARTGMRPGEALAVQWDDLDLAGKTVHVCRAMSMGEEGPTKTDEPRDVHLSAEVVAMLTRLRVARERETLRRGWSAVPPWIFCTTVGTPYDPANVLKAMRRALRKAELPAFRVYDLRHTFATLLLSKGVPITYVAGQLGHAKRDHDAAVVRALSAEGDSALRRLA
jgi:integrase